MCEYIFGRSSRKGRIEIMVNKGFCINFLIFFCMVWSLVRSIIWVFGQLLQTLWKLSVEFSGLYCTLFYLTIYELIIHSGFLSSIVNYTYLKTDSKSFSFIKNVCYNENVVYKINKLRLMCKQKCVIINSFARTARLG